MDKKQLAEYVQEIEGSMKWMSGRLNMIKLGLETPHYENTFLNESVDVECEAKQIYDKIVMLRKIIKASRY